MMLTDAGPLIALIDAGEEAHATCVKAVATGVRLPMLTTWPVLTEAMYLLGSQSGWPGQAALWQMVHAGHVEIATLSSSMVGRMSQLMTTYRDLPMDLADASLVALAEERGLTTVFSLDRHFHAYRLPKRRHFTVVPGP